ncbi:sporulation protein YqfD [Clostridium sp. CAG:470]|nr:MAG: sporulation protein YqfD [Clostridium sp. 28_17]CDE14777.1 sporulation protein YqfD [Clostridium sp. CAG:470]
MFIKIIFNYIIGYIRISIEGYYIERFINICGNEKITIWNLKRNKNVKLELNIGIKNLKKVAKIAKQTKCKMKIIKKKGLPFLFNRYRKRKLFFVFLLVIIIGLGISSNFVWNIQIVEEDKGSIENLYQDVVESGLEIGKMKSKINTKDIINKVRLKRNDIAWMGIELKGTNAIVKVVKATAKPEIVDDNEYCNIVSDKQGIITKINAQNGTIAVKVGDTVNVGTTLINGWMEGKYTGLRYVHAKGEIQAKVWHTKNKKILYNATEKTETGNIENKYQIKINNFEINLSKRLSKFKIYDTIVLENKFKIFSDFYLPISLVKITNKEIKEEQKNYNVEQAKDLGIEQLQEELDNEIEDKSKVVNKIINTYEKEDGIEVYVTYEVLEDIGTNEKIVF